MPEPKILRIYADGACKGNPGPGGWAAVLTYGDYVLEITGGESETTNNRMELTAVIKALEALKKKVPLEVFSDSSYVVKGISQWLYAWKARGWRKADRKPVLNLDLWQRLDHLAQQYDITWRWVEGHAGHTFNERADKLAAAAIPR